MQAEVPPASRAERTKRAVVAILLLTVVIGFPLRSVLRPKAEQGSLTFVDGFLHRWLVFMSINLVDLILIDWLIGVRWQPAHLSPPEIDPLRQHSTYLIHLVEHFKGTLVLTAVALVLGGLASGV